MSTIPRNLHSVTLNKVKAEAGVQIAQRWIVAVPRHRKFFQLGDLNEAMGELLDRLNRRPFHKTSRHQSNGTLFTLEVAQLSS